MQINPAVLQSSMNRITIARYSKYYNSLEQDRKRLLYDPEFCEDLSYLEELRANYAEKDSFFYQTESSHFEEIGADPYPKICKILKVMKHLEEEPWLYLSTLRHTSLLMKDEGVFQDFIKLEEIDQVALFQARIFYNLKNLRVLLDVLEQLHNPRLIIISFNNPNTDSQIIELVNNIDLALESARKEIDENRSKEVSQSFRNITLDFRQTFSDFNVTVPTILILLSRLYNEEIISEIIVRAKNENASIEISDVFNLAKNWERLKLDPIQWSLQLANNEL